MKTFLWVMLILVGVVLAVKLLPLALALVGLAGGAIATVIVVGLSVVAVLVCVGILLALLFSPLWLPALMVVGLIALIKRTNPKPAVA
jgi:hypothetical protein